MTNHDLLIQELKTRFLDLPVAQKSEHVDDQIRSIFNDAARIGFLFMETNISIDQDPWSSADKAFLQMDIAETVHALGIDAHYLYFHLYLDSGAHSTENAANLLETYLFDLSRLNGLLEQYGIQEINKSDYYPFT